MKERELTHAVVFLWRAWHIKKEAKVGVIGGIVTATVAEIHRIRVDELFEKLVVIVRSPMGVGLMRCSCLLFRNGFVWQTKARGHHCHDFSGCASFERGADRDNATRDSGKGVLMSGPKLRTAG